ncbi:NAD-dependent epimerase/dehydratase family protein [Mycobacteroides salmoniphilum]|uniref:3 beta-hydroxysteroid dehydrogenase/Delta 5-->4-isomerase n=1 Tax=Mycobacteroides salmoniphilum TaxID=404941 RepID=A0A4R8SU89_9MYCO|nr:NAD-dependent epimerase/dehydratase family protein [Mycobacteroides salmoniphilum]TEA04053.1 3 beta-hydroxysteroid dehydrogenase/Delta 5-->4-isomerase [Mycobacteroides salmoniphilum]
MTETVLVTGGNGFIARWSIVELLQRGYRVRTTVRSSTKDELVRTAVTRATDRADGLEIAHADLTRAEGWADAVDGCDYVLHIASPLTPDNPRDPDALLTPAREGTLNVLRAATAAGVRRVVMTSAANAASPSSYTEDGVTDETLWTNPDQPGLPAYRRSKTVAERTAWDFMTTYNGPTELTTVLPGAVFGPVLGADDSGSVQVIGRLLSGAMPGTPRIGLEVVDVRDLVDLHLRAMTSPHAAGERFLGTGEFMWMSDIAAVLREQLGPGAAKVPTRVLPNIVVRALALLNSDLRAITPGLGRRNRHSTAKAEHILGWSPRSGAETVTDCARDLLAQGLV